MLAPHLQRKRSPFDLRNLGWHVVQVLLLIAIVVWVRVIGLNGVHISGGWLRYWLTGHEAWEPFRWWSGRTAYSQSIDCVFIFGLAEWVKVLP
jgi:hypothetical protein